MRKSNNQSGQIFVRHYKQNVEIKEGSQAQLDARTKGANTKGRASLGQKREKQLESCFLEIWSEREDSNLRPPQPHCGALPGCATFRLHYRNGDNLNCRTVRIIQQSATPANSF